MYNASRPAACLNLRLETRALGVAHLGRVAGRAHRALVADGAETARAAAVEAVGGRVLAARALGAHGEVHHLGRAFERHRELVRAEERRGEADVVHAVVGLREQTGGVDAA